MNFELSNEESALKDLVARFVDDELIPLEPKVLSREVIGEIAELSPEEIVKVDARANELGLWGLDAPVELGGSGISMVGMIGVHSEIGKTICNYQLPPDSPNLGMLVETATESQRERYLEPHIRGETVSAIAISEPGAGADPAAMTTRAERDGDEWVINGRKIWISRMHNAAFTIVLAVTDKSKGGRGASAFIVDRGTPGFNVLRRIPMIGGVYTYEVEFDNCRIPAENLLGVQDAGFVPMQRRLSIRRIQMAAWCLGLGQRALDMMIEYAPQRRTFGAALSERQSMQWWIADGATRLHACRLMTYDAAAKVDSGQSARRELSMIKVACTEMAWDMVDNAMQMFGAMGMARELPLYQMANRIRLMRIYEGPSEVHRMVIARDLLR